MNLERGPKEQKLNKWIKERSILSYYLNLINSQHLSPDCDTTLASNFASLRTSPYNSLTTWFLPPKSLFPYTTMAINKGSAYQVSCMMIVFALLILTSPKTLLAYRPLKEEQSTAGVRESVTKGPLERGPLPPSSSSPCTYINTPGGSHGGHCEIHKWTSQTACDATLASSRDWWSIAICTISSEPIIFCSVSLMEVALTSIWEIRTKWSAD